jgi:DNA-binding response OmpR family regulator
LLKNDAERIELSDKESRLLEIFARQQNQLITRDRLLKEVWEDDGIFTARSLDVFVSKLRKKLKSDPSIQIANVYGKGYKLEILDL